MAASAILLGPPSRAISSRIAGTLLAGFLALVLAGRLAWYSLGGGVAESGSEVRLALDAGRKGPAATGSIGTAKSLTSALTAPAAIPGAPAVQADLLLQCNAGAPAAGASGAGFSRADVAKLQDWANLIKSNPNVRIAIRFHPAVRPGGFIDRHREAAAVMRLLTEQQIDAHRLRLELSDAPLGTGAGAGEACVIDIEASSG